MSRSSWDEVGDPTTPLKRIAEIAGSSYYAETSQEDAMWKIVRNFRSSPERDKALATIINVSGYKTSNIREVAAAELLKSPTATNDELIRIVLHGDHELKNKAAKRMIENGELTDFQRESLEKWVPGLMGVEDTEEKKWGRDVLDALTSSPRGRK